MIKKNIIDLVLLDMRLPDVDGLEVLKKVKEFDTEILVIMMTAYSDIQTAVAAMKSGAYHYINKPFELDELKLLIEKGLETKRLINEVRRLHRQQKEQSPELSYSRDEPPDSICQGTDRNDQQDTEDIRAHSGRERNREGIGRQCDSLSQQTKRSTFDEDQLQRHSGYPTGSGAVRI